MGNELKRKTSMLLHQIEESLGDFVLNNGDVESLNLDSLENIHQREVDKGRVFNRRSIKDIVEATYLDELFGFALDIALDTSVINSLNYLYSLFHHLDIYEVRNTISHPNRQFWDCYWYRIATIASDPVIEILGLNNVKKALAAAESGMITDPPGEWVHKTIWQIPNNLPDQFDHGLTGLIGRRKELQELEKFISNPRVNTIALVAPGGAGKTALALDLLNSIVSTPSHSKSIDAVLYATMKTEKLTSNGVVSLDSIETIEELKQNIIDAINQIYDEDYENFEETIKARENDKVLLCVDNLETLLRDSQTIFDDLNYGLPPAWQVLVTSRVAISNATILSLDALKEKSAIHLARTYLAKRGGASLDENSYVRLAKACFYNPLAIRLTIDLVIAGHDLPKSLDVANKEIAEFSYNNLINALSNDAIEILEAVFVEDSSTRLSLCELLEKDLDSISSAIGELSKTSLIRREPSQRGESYSLSDSVRDLLVISPRNIGIRSKVQDSIHKRRARSTAIDIRQDKNELPKWHTNFIPKDTNETLKILITEINRNLNKAKSNRELAINLFKKLKEAKFMHDGESLYHKAYARVLELLKDYNAAEEHYKTAIELNSSDPSSPYLLARLYHSTKRYELAKKTYQCLIDDGWVDKEEGIISFGKSIYTGYFLALLFLGQYEEVLESTKKWKESIAYREVLGAQRASAWKRKAEGMVMDDQESALNCLLSASKILSDIFRNEGYFNMASTQAIKVFEEIEFCFSRKEYRDKHPEKGIELLTFIANNIVEVSQTRSGKKADTDHLITQLKKIDIVNNPFNESNWDSTQPEVDFYDTDELVERYKGLTSVKISNRPSNELNYLFAKDDTGQDYFLHFDHIKDGDWKEWCQLEINMRLNVLPDERNNKPNKATNTKEIYLKIN